MISVKNITKSYGELDVISDLSFEIEDGKVLNVEFIGGCNGNLKGISKLVKGMEVDEVISRLEGTCCGMKPTSCPDQLATALKKAKEG